jgi:hypothetical protein
MGKKTKVREEERERNSSERGRGEINFKISIPWDRQRRVQITLIISSPSLAYSQSFPYSYFTLLLFTLVHFPLPLLSSLLSLYIFPGGLHGVHIKGREGEGERRRRGEMK